MEDYDNTGGRQRRAAWKFSFNTPGHGEPRQIQREKKICVSIRGISDEMKVIQGLTQPSITEHCLQIFNGFTVTLYCSMHSSYYQTAHSLRPLKKLCKGNVHFKEKVSGFHVDQTLIVNVSVYGNNIPEDSPRIPQAINALFSYRLQ